MDISDLHLNKYYCWAWNHFDKNRNEYCDYCNLCPGNNHSEHGDVRKAAENNCYMAKCRWSLAKRLMDGTSAKNRGDLIMQLESFPDFNENVKRMKS